VSTALQELKCLQRGDRLAVCGFASADWMLADGVALYTGSVLVPVPLNVSTEDMGAIVRRVGNSFFPALVVLRLAPLTPPSAVPGLQAVGLPGGVRLEG
jgi:hypothetical protein